MSDAVIVVGGGWAGLAAAVELSVAGQRVRLLESAPQLGGRARSVAFGSELLDNGQHLIIGAYRQTLALMQTIGVSPQKVFERRPLRLAMHSPKASGLTLQLPTWLPAPLNLLWALARAQGFNRAERHAALRLALGLGLRRFRLPRDLPLEALLRRYGQPETLLQRLWSPLCLATLNTPLHEASSELFLTVLRDSFSRRASDADMLLARHDLGRLLPQPATEFITAHGGEIRTGQRVTALLLEDGKLSGVRSGQQDFRASQVILATPPGQAAVLLRPLEPMADMVARLDELDSYPITTIYLRYPRAVTLPWPMLGLLDGPGQWVSERRVSGQPDVLSVVISGPGPHEAMDNSTLAEEIGSQLKALLPELPTPLEQMVIREKRATFRATAGVQVRRPTSRTPIEGLWLAGDYTAGPYPATLEGAVRSGVQCARRILRGT